MADSVMQELNLLVTDLDGTILSPQMNVDQITPFWESVNEFRRRNNGVWCISTGRSFSEFRKVFSRWLDMGIMPDYVISEKGRVYARVRGKLVFSPMLSLSSYINRTSERLSCRRLIRHLRRYIRRNFPQTRIMNRGKTRLFVQFASQAECEACLKELTGLAEKIRSVKTVARQHEIDLRSVPYTKGHAVEALCKHLKFTSSGVLAIGDGTSDMTLMDEGISGMTGCPANAHEVLKKLVEVRKGHIAEAGFIEGSTEVIQAWLNNCVVPRLVEGYEGDPWAYESRQRRSHHHFKNILVGVAIAYILLMVLAHFNLIPFSHVFMKPIELLAEWWYRVR